MNSGEQLSCISNEVLGRSDGLYSEIMDGIRSLKASSVILIAHHNARSRGSDVIEACDNLKAEIESLLED